MAESISTNARTSAIYKEKFSVPLSGDEPNDLFNIVKHSKTFTGLAEITKSKGLGDNPGSQLSYRTLLSYGDTKKYFSLFLQEPLKIRVNSKYQSKGPIYIYIKMGFGIVTKNCVGCGFLVKKEQ